MTFKNRLNEYLNNINCSSKELSIKSNVSESVISRYRNGDRTPKIDSKQLKDIAAAIECIIKEKNIEEYLYDEYDDELDLVSSQIYEYIYYKDMNK